jgi:hypothetical protein
MKICRSCHSEDTAVPEESSAYILLARTPLPVYHCEEASAKADVAISPTDINPEKL